MPIYEYKCEGCGETFEVIQKFADDPVTVHEKCGGHVHRLMSAPSFQFKGSGWYVTDYAKGGSGAPKSDTPKSESASKSTETTATSTETKSDSKPASKPATSNESSKTESSKKD